MGRKLPDNFVLPSLYPFGCLVDFLPSPIFQKKFPKWGAKAQPGILLCYITTPGGVWKGEYMVALLADFQQGESRAQVHTVREAIPIKIDGDFVFPLKANYEKARNTIKEITPQSSDNKAQEPDDDNKDQDKTSEDSPFDVPPTLNESDTQNDASEQNTNDSAPKSTGEATSTPVADTVPSSETAARKGLSGRRTYVGSTTACDVTTRNYKGSKRPPDIPGVIWQTLSKKAKASAHESFLKTGYGWQPTEPTGVTAPTPSGATVDGIISALHSSVPAMPIIAPCRESKGHRTKVPDIETIHNICVARPISLKEAATIPAAKAALDKEWDKLEKQQAWLINEVREQKDVETEAKAKNEVVHVASVFGLLHEKGSELHKCHPDSKRNRGIVFQGAARDQSGDSARFKSYPAHRQRLPTNRWHFSLHTGFTWWGENLGQTST